MIRPLRVFIGESVVVVTVGFGDGGFMFTSLWFVVLLFSAGAGGSLLTVIGTLTLSFVFSGPFVSAGSFVFFRCTLLRR